MSSLKIALATFWAPERSLSAAAEGRRFFWPILLATLINIGFTAIAIPRVDLGRTVADQLEGTGAAAKMTPHEREEAIDTARKVGSIGMVASSAFGPTINALLVAFCLWLAFKVAGGAPQFAPTFAIATHAFLPLSLKHLLMIPALMTRTGLLAQDLQRLLPSNLAALLPEGTPFGPKVGLLASLDLFSLWAIGLVAVGMGYVAQVSRPRAAVTSAVIWASFVAVFGIAVPALTSGAGR